MPLPNVGPGGHSGAQPDHPPQILDGLSSADGTKQTHEVARGGGRYLYSILDPLGLTLDDSKILLASVQRHLVQAVDEWRRQERDIRTRSEAARRLIATALKALGRIGADPERAAAGAKAPRRR